MSLKSVLRSVLPKPFYSALKTCVIKILSTFIKTNPKMIIFMSFDGKRYDDSPKAIYEKIINDNRFKDYIFVWALINPKKFNIEKAIKVKMYSLKYYYYAFKARCCVTNASNTIWEYKTPDALYFNTWHGTAIKKLGSDVENNNYSADISLIPDIMCAQGRHDIDVFSRRFKIERDKILLSGLPRNDILANYSRDIKLNISDKLNLPKDKKIILYCPTFRDYDIENSKNDYLIKPPINFKEWENRLGNDYIILFRAHYFIAKILNIEFNNFIRDFSDYECLNDLIIASDMLISDYSSVYFDYAITGKPMLCFAYDYEKYMENRGVYINIKKELPCEVAYNEKSLLEQILNIDYEKMSSQTIKFRDKYVEVFGNASQICVDKIWDNIN